MTTTPSKAEQDAEAHARTQAKGAIPAGETAEALDVLGDADPVAPAPAPIQPQAREAKEPPRVPEAKSKFDSKRDEIQARFRTQRNEIPADEQDDIADFARSNGMPPEFKQFEQGEQPRGPDGRFVAQEAADAPASPDQGDATPAEGPAVPPPQTYKIKVHGKEMEVSHDDLIAKAQIAYASENLLDQSKSKLKEIEALEAEIRNRAAHPAQPVQHQDEQSQVPSPDQPIDKKLVEMIQFGDPDEAEAAIQKTIEARTQQIVQQQLLNARLADEGARAAKVLKDFEDHNPEIAKDERARAAIEVSIYGLQLEDIKALGVDPARLRPDGLPATPADIAKAHRFYRAQGFSVRSPQVMLEKARDDFLAWKGVPKQPAADAAPAPKPPVKVLAPKVDLTVDRQQRRQAAPQQPSRSAAPTAPASAPVAPRDRSSVVQGMRARNAKLRGQALGIE